MIRAVLASALLMVTVTADARTPAAWLVDHQQCIGQAVEERMASITHKLSKNASRKLAEEIYLTCANLMPRDMSATDSANFIHEESRRLAKRLRYQSGNSK